MTSKDANLCNIAIYLLRLELVFEGYLLTRFCEDKALGQVKIMASSEKGL